MSQLRITVPGEGPFTPAHTLIATLLLGLPGGGLLAALNWDRLGQPARKMPTLIGAVVAYALLLGIGVLAFAYTGMVQVLTLGLLLNAAGGIGLAYMQRHAYADWVTRNDGPPSAEQIAFRRAAVPLGLLIFVEVCVLLPLVVLVILPSARAALPAQTYTRGGLTLTAPRSWRLYTVSDDPLCQQADTTCLLSLHSPSGMITLDAVRVIPANATGAEEAADSLWADIVAVEADAALEAREAWQLGEVTAVELRYSQPNPFLSGGEVLHVRQFVAVVDNALYRLTVLSPDADELAAAGADLDAILASIRLTR